MRLLRLSLRLLLPAALAGAILLGHAPAQNALAHASLVSSQPEDGAILSEPPERVILIFNETVSPLRLQLVGGQGAIPLTDIVQHDTTVILKMPAVAQGTHGVSWRVVSADGHPVGGTLVFSVGRADAAGPLTQTQSSPVVRTAIWFVRVMFFITLFFGLGGAVFAHWIATSPLPGRTENIFATLCATGFLLLPLSIGLQGLDALDLPLRASLDAAPWRAGFSTTYGTTALLAMFAFMAAWMSLRAEAGKGKSLSLLALALAAGALAASGHAAAASPQLLMRPTVALHVGAVIFWIGSLWPLRRLLASPDAAPTVLHRFSAFIPWAVAALIASGIVLAVVQLARPDALWTTNYGAILTIKLILVALLFGFAALNRFFLTREAAAGDALTLRLLRRSIAAEMALALAIFAVAAGWRFTPPPRAILADEQAEFVHLHSGAVMADLTLTPGRVGRSEAEIMIRDANYQPMPVKGVTLVFSLPENGIEPLRREAGSLGDNRWRIEDVAMPVPGRWQMRVEVLIDDFQKVSLEDEMLIPR